MAAKSIKNFTEKSVKEIEKPFEPFLKEGHIFDKEVLINFYFTPKRFIYNLNLWFYLRFYKEVNYQDLIYV